MNGKGKNSKTEFDRLDAMTDEDIDYSDIPELDEEFWKNAEWFIGGKKAISIRLDMDVYLFFKDMGKGYQTAINQVLRQYMKSQERKQR